MIASWRNTARSGGLRIGDSWDTSLERTYDQYGRLLFSIAYRVLGDRADAEDCVHDTLLRIWKNQRAYDAARGEFKSFLAVATRNAAISLLRKRNRHRTLEESVHQDHPAHEFDIPDYLERSHLHAALRALPLEQWDVVRLGYFEYLTHVQIAEKLNLPLGTVKSRIALAIQKLASAMAAQGSSR